MLINQVDLRRENLKMKIDNYSVEIIQSIKSTTVRLNKTNKKIQEIKDIKKQTEKKGYSFHFNEIMIADIFGNFNFNSIRVMLLLIMKHLLFKAKIEPSCSLPRSSILQRKC